MLIRPDVHSRFRVLSRTIFNEKYRDKLVTSSEDSDDKILANGYRFYY